MHRHLQSPATSHCGKVAPVCVGGCSDTPCHYCPFVGSAGESVQHQHDKPFFFTRPVIPSLSRSAWRLPNRSTPASTPVPHSSISRTIDSQGYYLTHNWSFHSHSYARARCSTGKIHFSWTLFPVTLESHFPAPCRRLSSRGWAGIDTHYHRYWQCKPLLTCSTVFCDRRDVSQIVRRGAVSMLMVD